MATKNKSLSRKELAAAEIDCRIHELILKFLEGDSDLTTKQIIGFFRVAYSQGYTDCLREPEGQRGVWIKDLGYGVKGVEI